MFIHDKAVEIFPSWHTITTFYLLSRQFSQRIDFLTHANIFGCRHMCRNLYVDSKMINKSFFAYTPAPVLLLLEIYFGPSSAKVDPFLFPHKSFHFSSLFPDISLLPSENLFYFPTYSHAAHFSSFSKCFFSSLSLTLLQLITVE